MSDDVPPPDNREWSFLTKLAYERQALGMYVSGHPLSIVDEQISEFRDAEMKDFDTLKPSGKGEVYKVAGLVTELDLKQSRSQKKMAKFQLDDMTGLGRVTVFPMVFANIKGKFGPDSVVKIKARLEDGEFGRQFIVKEMEAFDIREMFEKAEKKNRARVDITSEGISTSIVVPEKDVDGLLETMKAAGFTANREDL